jgi:hypothetical protein
MRRILALAIFATAVTSVPAEDQSSSPYATAADFAKYAMKLREQALLKVEPMVQIPTASRAMTTRYPWKSNIVTTVFWVGEQASANNPVPNNRSSWDLNWTSNSGGIRSAQLHTGCVRSSRKSVLFRAAL